MVAYVKKPNRVWASENLDSALATYNLDALWVCDAAMRPVHTVLRPHLDAFKRMPAPAGATRWIRSAGPYYHFMMRTNYGLLEVRGASIHASNNSAHTGPAKGYLFAGRIWDNEYLSEIGSGTGSRATLVTGRAPGETADPDTMQFITPLPGWDGKTVANLKLVSTDETGSALRKSSVQFMLVTGAFLVVLLGVVGWCLYSWVTRPLGLLLGAMSSEDARILKQMQRGRSELGVLARLVGDFFEQKAELTAVSGLLERRVADRTAELAEANSKLKAAYDATIEGWARALDLRDHDTEGHSRRVADMTLMLARLMGIPEEELEHYKRGALLHDIGKVGIPDAILNKPGPLSDEEWDLMRLHPEFARQMLEPIAFLRPSIDIPFCHHEKWDGTGYPRGVAGEKIPQPARILPWRSIWDALTSERPYRQAWPQDRVRAHIGVSLSGTHFDPRVVEAMMEVLDVGDCLDRAA